MASHCSILAWRIPWTEEPGELLSMELQRVRHTHRDTSRQNPRVEGTERTCHHSELLTREHCGL